MTTAAAPAPVAAPAAAAKPIAPPNGAAKPAVGKAPPVGAKPGEAPPAAEPQKYKLTVDGEAVEMTLEEMQKWASKGRFSDKATQEAKEAIKRAQRAAQEIEARERARIEKLKADPDAYLRENGIDPDAYARSKFERKVAEQKMTPEQREAMAAKQRADDAEKKLKDVEAQRQAEQHTQLTNHLQRNIESQLAAATKRAGMEMSDEGFYAVYESFREAFELGLLPLDGGGLQPHHADRIIEDAMSRISGAQQNLEKAVLAGLKGEPLLKRLGPAVVRAVLEARREQVYGAKTPAPGAPPAKPMGAPKKSSQYLTPAEADEQMKKLARGGQ